MQAVNMSAATVKSALEAGLAAWSKYDKNGMANCPLLRQWPCSTALKFPRQSSRLQACHTLREARLTSRSGLSVLTLTTAAPSARESLPSCTLECCVRRQRAT